MRFMNSNNDGNKATSHKDLIKMLRQRSVGREKILGKPSVSEDELETMFLNQYRLLNQTKSVTADNNVDEHSKLEEGTPKK